MLILGKFKRNIVCSINLIWLCYQNLGWIINNFLLPLAFQLVCSLSPLMIEVLVYLIFGAWLLLQCLLVSLQFLLSSVHFLYLFRIRVCSLLLFMHLHHIQLEGNFGMI